MNSQDFDKIVSKNVAIKRERKDDARHTAHGTRAYEKQIFDILIFGICKHFLFTVPISSFFSFMIDQGCCTCDCKAEKIAKQ